MIKERLTILASILIFASCGIAYSADGVTFPSSLTEDSQKQEEIQYSKAAKISKEGQSFFASVQEIFSKNGKAGQVEGQKQESKQLDLGLVEDTGQEAKKYTFTSALLNMLKVLAVVVALIFTGVGLILAYRKYKSGTPQKQEEQTQIINEPANISEAVASFVRHKLNE